MKNQRGQREIRKESDEKEERIGIEEVDARGERESEREEI